VKEQRVSLEAIESVYRARGADFFRFALAKTGDLERARDAVQEGFARAIRSRELFRGSGSLEAWIGRCVINAAYDANRAASTIGVDEEPGDVSIAPTDELGSTIRDAVLPLPQRQRDALFLRHYFGATPSGSSERPNGITFLSGSSPQLPTYIVGSVARQRTRSSSRSRTGTFFERRRSTRRRHWGLFGSTPRESLGQSHARGSALVKHRYRSSSGSMATVRSLPVSREGRSRSASPRARSLARRG
jgi:DNA-directed RNA polymerase specialized sigma24 family protein